MNNAVLYNAVIGGVLSASCSLRNGVSLAANYTAVINKAVALAVLVDNAIAPGNYHDSQAAVLQGLTGRILLDRNVVGTTPNLTSVKDDILRLWTESLGAYAVLPPYTADGMRHGPTANRPIPSSIGETYWNETTQTAEIWNGANWTIAIPAGYDDVQGTIDPATAVASLTYETYRDTPFFKYWFRRDQDDALSMTYQMRHNWLFTDVEPHVHLIPAGDTDGNIVLSGRYCWSAFSSELEAPAWGGWTPFSVTTPILGAKQWKPKPISLGLVTPPAAAKYPSAMLWVWIQRPGATDPNDTYAGNKPAPGTAAANVAVEFADCHIQLAGFGTVGLYA